MRLSAAYATDVGRVREVNEDSLLVDEHVGLFAVADGMGGHRGGEVASSTAIEALRAAVAAGSQVDAAIITANDAVLERAAGDPQLTGMGTTLTAIQPLGAAQLLIGHVGDSRAYRLRDGHLERLTDDHSLVEELVRDGRLTPEQAEVHPQRNIVTRALGVEPDVAVDLLTVAVDDGDRLLICSDGLTSMVREREVERMLAQAGALQPIADRLVDEAVKNGGEDNVTVVVVEVVAADGDDPAPGAPGEPAEHATPPDPLDEPTGEQPAVRATLLAPFAEAGRSSAPAAAVEPLARRRRARRSVPGTMLFAVAIAIAVAVAIYWLR